MRVCVVKTALSLVLGEGIPGHRKTWCISSYYLEGLITGRMKRWLLDFLSFGSLQFLDACSCKYSHIVSQGPSARTSCFGLGLLTHYRES